MPLARKCIVENISPLALKCDESFHLSLPRRNCVMTHDLTHSEKGKDNTVSRAKK